MAQHNPADEDESDRTTYQLRLNHTAWLGVIAGCHRLRGGQHPEVLEEADDENVHVALLAVSKQVRRAVMSAEQDGVEADEDIPVPIDAEYAHAVLLALKGSRHSAKKEDRMARLGCLRRATDRISRQTARQKHIKR